MAGNVCDCCNQPFADGAGSVASSSIGAISFAFCQRCLLESAEPEIMFIHLRDDVARPDEPNLGLREEVFDMVTFKDGKYITFRDWVKDNPPCAQQQQ